MLIHDFISNFPFNRGMKAISLSRLWLHIPVEWKFGYKVINKQVIIQMLIVNTAFYIYDDIRLKEISIMNSFEQIQENTRFFDSARQLGRGFHTRLS